jgi:hypothetical protein
MRFSHMYTIAFDVNSHHQAKDIEENEILAALAGKLQDMIANKGEIFEAVGLPEETVELTPDVEPDLPL